MKRFSLKKSIALMLLTLMATAASPPPRTPVKSTLDIHGVVSQGFENWQAYSQFLQSDLSNKSWGLGAQPLTEDDCYHQKITAFFKTKGLEQPAQLPFGFKSWKDFARILALEPSGASCAQVSMAAPSGAMPAIPTALDWSPENKTKLDKFFASGNLKGQVAVFDADDTLWRTDAGEGFLKYLIAHKKLANLPAGFDPFANYEALCAQNKWMGYPYATQVMAGMKVSEIQALAKEFFKTFHQNVYPGQRALIQRLQQAGVDVWIVSASPQWLIEQGAPYLGVPANRVVGVRLAVANGLATPHLIPPMTFRQGKVEAINKYIGKVPVYVSGDSITDFEMLQIASRMQMVINPKDKNAPEDNIFLQATRRGWPIQRW